MIAATLTSCTRTASNAPHSFLRSIFSMLNSTSPTSILAPVCCPPLLPFVTSVVSHPSADMADYRRVPRVLSHAYFSPLNSTTRAAINAQFAALTEGISIQDGKTIRLWGRDLTVPRCAGLVAQFTFAELCGRPLGAADYLELTQRFGTLFVTDVPRMGMGEKDKVGRQPRLFCCSYSVLRQARRFITFIDACYDSKTRLFVSSEVPIFEIFSDDSSNSPGVPLSDHMRAIMDELVRARF
jgi:peroxisome-assembly ATPase